MSFLGRWMGPRSATPAVGPAPGLPERIRQDAAMVRRRSGYQVAQMYYDGEQRLPPRAGRSRGQNAVRNWAALLVDTMVDYMGRPTVTWPDEEEASEHLSMVLDDNDAESLDHEIELTAAILGDAVQRVQWDAEAGRVAISWRDPGGIWAQVDPVNASRYVGVADQYLVSPSDGPLEFGGHSLGRATEKTVLTEYWTAEAWEIWEGETLVLPLENPYQGMVPYIITPNQRRPGSLWGVSDVLRLRRLQDRHDRVAADLDWVMEVSAGVVVLAGVENSLDIGVTPGAVWELPEGANAFLLDILGNAGVQQRLWHAGEINEAMHRIARVPESATSGAQGRELSGRALEIELGPLLRQTERKRLTRSWSHRERARMVRHLGAMFAGVPAASAGARASVEWHEALPVDAAADLANAQQGLVLGRSRETLLAELGVADPAAELDRRIAEDARLRRAQPAEVQAGD